MAPLVGGGCGLLEEDVAVAAQAIERLTGKILASMVKRPNKTPLWTVEFSVDLSVDVVLELLQAARKVQLQRLGSAS